MHIVVPIWTDDLDKPCDLDKPDDLLSDELAGFSSKELQTQGTQTDFESGQIEDSQFVETLQLDSQLSLASKIKEIDEGLSSIKMITNSRFKAMAEYLKLL